MCDAVIVLAHNSSERPGDGEEDGHQNTAFHSAETLHFMTILFHDGFGSPRCQILPEFELGTQALMHCLVAHWQHAVNVRHLNLGMAV